MSELLPNIGQLKNLSDQDGVKHKSSVQDARSHQETLRNPEPPSGVPTGLLANRRLYRFKTDARFSFPLGKATSPAAVPVRPLRHEIAISTSLTMSRSIGAVVHFPLACFAGGGKLPCEIGGDDCL